MLMHSTINLRNKFEMPVFTHSKDMLGFKKFVTASRDNGHAHFQAVCLITSLVKLQIAYH